LYCNVSNIFKIDPKNCFPNNIVRKEH
jgi:hypothetical protein